MSDTTRTDGKNQTRSDMYSAAQANPPWRVEGSQSMSQPPRKRQVLRKDASSIDEELFDRPAGSRDGIDALSGSKGSNNSRQHLHEHQSLSEPRNNMPTQQAQMVARAGSRSNVNNASEVRRNEDRPQPVVFARAVSLDSFMDDDEHDGLKYIPQDTQARQDKEWLTSACILKQWHGVGPYR
eukprot:Nitzschia sp. Nitz4//scaffold204_size40132//35754//36299//NITZ4_007547-RA/size40132-processed-gene-0.19-mRNA-1//1//CDS//3329541488//2946//frame0